MACNFDENGLCQAFHGKETKNLHSQYKNLPHYKWVKYKGKWERKNTGYQYGAPTRWHRIFAPGIGCCNRCFFDQGYFYQGDDKYSGSEYKGEKGRFEKYKHLFLPIVGFWRIGGCSIPYAEKSYICRSFKCSYSHDDDRIKGENR